MVSAARYNAQYSFKTTRLKTFGSQLVYKIHTNVSLQNVNSHRSENILLNSEAFSQLSDVGLNFNNLRIISPSVSYVYMQYSLYMHYVILVLHFCLK